MGYNLDEGQPTAKERLICTIVVAFLVFIAPTKT